MSLPTHLFSCDDPNGSSACVYTLFDLIKDSPQNVNIDYVVLRTGRTGTAFLVMGAYITIVSLNILVPNKAEPVSLTHDYHLIRVMFLRLMMAIFGNTSFGRGQISCTQQYFLCSSSSLSSSSLFQLFMEIMLGNFKSYIYHLFIGL